MRVVGGLEEKVVRLLVLPYGKVAVGLLYEIERVRLEGVSHTCLVERTLQRPAWGHGHAVGLLQSVAIHHVADEVVHGLGLHE